MADTKNNEIDADDEFIKIAESEDSEFMEFPREEDGSLLLSTVQTQFPNAIGLKYKGSSGAYRAIREVDNVLAAPKGGWGNDVYIVTVSATTARKRTAETTETSNQIPSKQPKTDALEKDLAVIGIPFKLTKEELKEYFENNYGETSYCDIKTDRDTGKSRGFGFVRFKDAETAKEALEGEHFLLGRQFAVKLKKEKPMKLFVGRLPNDTAKEDLEKYFSQFGEVKDTYIPQPFRNFAFITFGSTDDGRACLKLNHEMKGSKLNVMVNDRNEGQKGDNRNGGRQSYNDRSSQSSFGGGYPTYSNSNYGKSNYGNSNNGNSNYGNQGFQGQQMPSLNNMDNQMLKSMLFQFLNK